MMNALIQYCQTLESSLPAMSELMTMLNPKLSMVGSVPEATRLGLANELDRTITFAGWPEATFCVKEDPFYLRKACDTPVWMDYYFDSSDCFRYNQFKYDLMVAIEKAVEISPLPSGLRLVTSNRDFRIGKRRCRNECSERQNEVGLFKQCKYCAVVVSQTKVGVCLQFEYVSQLLGIIYCSVDLIPMFNIREMPSMGLAKIFINALLGPDRPLGWFKSFTDYVKCDKVTHDLADEVEIKTIKTVSLKTLRCSSERNYYIRPGQVLGPKKFSNKLAEIAYMHIKYITKCTDAELNMYWVKKELRTGMKDENFFYHSWIPILRKSRFKRELNYTIDYEKWMEDGVSSKLPLRG